MPKHSKLMQLTALAFFAAGWISFIYTKLFLTLTLWGAAFLFYIWDNHQYKKQAQEFKKAFIAKYLPQELCMSAQSPNLIYKIIEETETLAKIQLIWSGEEPVLNGEIYEVDPATVRPFDEEVFLMLS